jgi:hypothetical protein
MNQNRTHSDSSQATVANQPECTPGVRKDVRRETEVHSNFKPTPGAGNCEDGARQARLPIQSQ